MRCFTCWHTGSRKGMYRTDTHQEMSLDAVGGLQLRMLDMEIQEVGVVKVKAKALSPTVWDLVPVKVCDWEEVTGKLAQTSGVRLSRASQVMRRILKLMFCCIGSQ